MDVVMPQLGETVTEGTVTAWLKKVGEWVEADEPLFEVETEKVTGDIPAPISGTLAEILVPEGETVEVGTVLAILEGAEGSAAPGRSEPAAATAGPGAGSPQAAPAARAEAAHTAPAMHPQTGSGQSLADALSPAVRRLLAQHGLTADQIVGSGRDGRLTRQDVLAHLEAHPGQPAKAPAAPGAAAAKPGANTGIPFNKYRRATAAHMVRSKATSPHVLQGMEVDFFAVEKARSAHGAGWLAREGFKLSYLPFVAHALCGAIADFPHVNARIEGDSLLVHNGVNLGIAVDLSFAGLIVPVLKGAGGKPIAALAREIQELVTRAREEKLRPDDMTEGSYTLSNAGPFGTYFTAPIINQPQVAILSLDGIKKRPVVLETPAGDEIAIRPVGLLAQSFDHRAFDGAYSAAFLRRLKEILEQTDWAEGLG